MRVYTTKEASELSGLSVRALRKRVERGQLRAVQHGRYWRIPHSELERHGLVGPEGTAGDEGTEGTQNDLAPVMAELERVRTENARLTQELARLRPLPAQVETITEDLFRERAERQAAQQAGEQAREERDELRTQLEEIASAGPIRAFRLRRKLRAEQAE